VSDREKARLTRQVGIRKTFQKRSVMVAGRALLRRRKFLRRHRNRRSLQALRDELGGDPIVGQAVPGV